MPTVVHKFLTRSKITRYAPGYADFMRGTLVLYEKAKKYGYTLELDYSHPLLKMLQCANNKQYDGHVHEMICPISFPMQDVLINKMFLSGEDFMLLTNILPNNFYNTPLNPDTKEYLKKTFAPNLEIQTIIDGLIPKEDYIVIHVRTGDHYMLNSNGDNNKHITWTRNLIKKISDPLVGTPGSANKNIFLLADNLIFKNTIAKEFCNVVTTSADPIHSGCFENATAVVGDVRDNSIQNDERFQGVLIDFGIFSKAKCIYCVSDNMGSGYSYMASYIYDVPYENVCK